MASSNPYGKRRGSMSSGPRKRAKPTPVWRSRRTYPSFSNFVNQIIIPAVKENEYTYSPLSSPSDIRLLILNPSPTPDDPVYCQLVSSADHPADEPPLEYEALSYTWGDDDPIHEIKILNVRKQGQRPSLKKIWAKFFVRSNLHAALRHLRDSHHRTYLWVDALCINQKDDMEKNTQVAMMAEIYNRASNVCIWLGVGDPKSKVALESIPRILDGPNFDNIVGDETKSGFWQSLAFLMQNQWFSRRWVVQELALARQATLHCGRIEIAWEDFAVTVALFMKEFERIQPLVRKTGPPGTNYDPLENIQALGANTLVEALSNFFRKSHGGEVIERLSSLESLVSTLLTFDVSEPRDIIYAVLSIAKDTALHSLPFLNAPPPSRKGPTPPVADYKKNLTEVCKEFVQYCVQTSESLDIICRHWAPVPKKRQRSVLEKIRNVRAPAKEQLPSWISSVSRSPFGAPEDVLNGRVNGDSLVGSPERKNYNAAPGTVAIVLFGEVEDIYIPPASTTPTGSNLPSPLNRPFPSRLASNLMTSHSASASEPSSSRRPSINQPALDSRFISSTVANNSGPEQTSYDRPLTKDASTQLASSRARPPPSLDINSANKVHGLYSIPEAKKMKSDGTLFVKGFRLGVIANLSSRIAEGTIPRECLEMGGWIRPDPEVLEVPKVPDELWRTLVADRGADGKNPPPWYPRACQECMAHSTTNGDLNIRTLIETGTPGIMVQFLKRVQCIIWNRKFIQSEVRTFENMAGKAATKKLFGLAPELAKAKDIICIFLGCSVPVILREHRVSSDHYFEFIGEAYIYGMMDGEALGGKKMDELKETCEEFKLR